MEMANFVELKHITKETLSCKLNLDSRLRGNDKKDCIPALSTWFDGAHRKTLGTGCAGMTFFVRGD